MANLSLLSEEFRREIALGVNLPKETADEAILEFLRFATLALDSPGRKAHAQRFIPVVQLIDKVWHFCLLQTREYAALCEAIAPGRFLHHRTILYDAYRQTVPDVRDLHQEDLSWIASYVASFGGFTERTIQYWRIPTLLLSELGWDVERVNALGRELVDKACASTREARG